MEHVDITEKFLAYLKRHHTGEGKAVQSKGLEFRFQMSGRKIRDIVNELRCDGYPICSDENGYYYAANKKEVMRSISQLNSRIEKISEAKNGLVNACTNRFVKLSLYSWFFRFSFGRLVIQSSTILLGSSASWRECLCRNTSNS